ncbi:MAG: phytanoyl-CoA dioxygenase family protein [Gammaproteobacteria bacterium]|nr:phytanoyl-CoA dioxygenase family protein [Gammaproteobacteria bacterium]
MSKPNNINDSTSVQALSVEQREFFQRQGYLILRAAAAADRLALLQNQAELQLQQARSPLEYEADVHYPGSPDDYQQPGGSTLRRLLQAWDRSPVFQQWAGDPVIVKAIGDLLGSDRLCLELAHHNCIMTKHPQYSSSTLWHQDFRYWKFQHNALVSAWLALSHETARNGCMRLIPGSHRLALEAQRFDDRQFFRADHSGNRELMHQAVRAELQPGDLLLFHSGLLHAAGRNHGDTVKLALVFSYRAAHNLPVPGGRAATMGSIDLQLAVPG